VLKYSARNSLAIYDIWKSNIGTFESSEPSHRWSRASCADLILSFEIELDLHIVRVVEENLPTGAVGHLVHAVGHAFAGEVSLRCLKTATTERNMIDDT
jgi:hypothetical protein